MAKAAGGPALAKDEAVKAARGGAAPPPPGAPPPPPEAADAPNFKVVHGEIIDLNKAAAVAEDEELAWKFESSQREVLEQLEPFVEKAEGDDGVDAWSVIDYNQVMDLLKRGRDARGDNEADPYHTGLYPVLMRGRRLAEEFEVMEGNRRAAEKFAKMKEDAKNRTKTKNEQLEILDTIRPRINQVKLTEYKGAEKWGEDDQLLPELNGFLYPETGEVESAVRAALSALVKARDRQNKLPIVDRDLVDADVENLVAATKRCVKAVERAERAAKAELNKRDLQEEEAQRAKAEAERKAQEEKERMEAEKKAAAEAERKRLEDEEKERIRLEKEKRERREQQKKELAAAKEAAEAEMKAYREAREKEKAARKAREEEFAKLIFTDPTDKAEAEARRKREEEEAIAAELEAQKRERQRMEELKAEAARREEELRAQQEAEEKERIAKQIQREKELEAAKFKAAAFERDMVQRKKDEAEALKAAEIRAMRSAIDAGEDDTEMEIEAREEARAMLKEYDGKTFTRETENEEERFYNGDVWQACRDDNVRLMRAYFLVHGSKLLALRSKKRIEGGRTLLHTACWWGCVKVIDYLFKLGADPNATDLSMSLTTPLHEAARAGRSEICKILIEAGASVRAQDIQGDTPIHWASRRGWGTLLCMLVKWSEKFKPGSSRGILKIKNNKGKVALEVAKNETVVQLVNREQARLAVAEGERSKLVGRLVFDRVKRNRECVIASLTHTLPKPQTAFVVAWPRQRFWVQTLGETLSRQFKPSVDAMARSVLAGMLTTSRSGRRRRRRRK